MKRLRSLGRNNTYNFLFDNSVVEVDLAFITKSDQTVLGGKESVVSAEGDIFTRQDISTALAHEDRPRFSEVAGSNLDSQIFWVGITTVFGCTC